MTNKQYRRLKAVALAAEASGLSLVILDGVSYRPVNCSDGALVTWLTRTRPHFFLRGEKLWTLEWLEAYLPLLANQGSLSYNDVLAKIDHCAQLCDSLKKQVILYATMDAEFQERDWKLPRGLYDYYARIS